MAVGRIQIASNKKAALLKQNMREVAVLLADDPPKEEKAKIRAEALIRDDNVIEAYEILQLECELLHERIKVRAHSFLFVCTWNVTHHSTR
jgi:vacuolar protein sorting-associated protein IST1